jgi:BirA family biotin operon repressor/biotin-[acetyl-CoA-carboxylase] ligase
VDFDLYVAALGRERRSRGPENVMVLETVASTNSLARKIVAEYENEGEVAVPVLLLAYGQTAGRGRHGRSWTSVSGKGVYATRVARFADAEVLARLPLAVGSGLCRALSVRGCRLKWPNDLVIEEGGERRKLGGVLIEATTQPDGAATAIVGFGVNVLQEKGDLPETGTSLVLSGVAAPSLAAVTWDLVAAVEQELERVADGSFEVAEYAALSVHRPGERISCRVGERTVEGGFGGFAADGRLILVDGAERTLVSAGEIVEP